MAIQQYPLPKSGIPSGNTANRPASPVIGDTYYNGELAILEIWNGTEWVPVSAPPGNPTIATPTDASTVDAYTSTAGKLSVVFTPAVIGGVPSQYNIYTTSGGFSASSSSTTVTLTGLTPGTAYTIYGNAQNNFGKSIDTANAPAVTPTTLPEVRTIGTATTSSVTTDVTVTWTNGNNGGKVLSAITITPYLNGTTAQTSQTAATTSSTSHTFTGLSGGSSYTFKVKATNANGNSAESTATNSVTIPNPMTVDYLIVAGGGGGGSTFGGGGGAGGYRSFTSQNINIASANFAVVVGAGGTGSTNVSVRGGIGGNSSFNSISATGGGGGTSNAASPLTGGNGGSGGGAGGTGNGPNNGGSGNAGAYSPSEGNNGGNSSASAPSYGSGGGGGASGAGGNGTSTASGNGGTGTANSITGSSVTYAGGGGAGVYDGANSGTGGAGGGGNGAAGGSTSATAGAANTGGGGGGGGQNNTNGANGGSGVVIIKYPDTRTITFGAGLTGTESSASGGFKRATITAGSGNVSWT